MVKIKIKTWKTMEEEFGLDMDDDILCDHYFTKKMEKEMPRDRIIKVEERGDRYLWRCGNLFPYVISKDMVEQVVGSKANKEQYAVLLRTGDTVECVSVDRLDFESQNWIKLDNIKVGDILTVIGTGVDSRGTHLLLSGKMFMHHASKFRKIGRESDVK